MRNSVLDCQGQWRLLFNRRSVVQAQIRPYVRLWPPLKDGALSGATHFCFESLVGRASANIPQSRRTPFQCFLIWRNRP